MNKLQEFYQLLKQDEALQRAVKEVQENISKLPTAEQEAAFGSEIIKLAKEKNLSLTEEDFRNASGALDEEALKAVTGGGGSPRPSRYSRGDIRQ